MFKKYAPKDFGNDVRDYTCNGKCSCCGNCCIPWCPITNEEYKIIKDYIEKNNIKPIPLFDGKNYYMDCCFHDRTNKKCLIYEVRPEVCKNFICSSPFEKIDQDRKYFDRRADINGDSGNIKPFDLLFYDNPITLLILINHEFKAESLDAIKYWLNRTGNEDIATAIENKQIILDMD